MQDLEKRLEEVLASVPEDAVQKPYTDPQGAAVTALLVADWLASVESTNAERTEGTDATLAPDLAALARSMMSIVESLGGEYLPDGVGIPGDLVHRGQAVRAQAISELEKHLKDAEAKAWIDAVRLGMGVVDLVYDLRTLGALHARRADVLPPEAAKVPTSVRAAADAIEYALRAGEKEAESQARAKIARIWTALAPLYEKASAAGRAHTRGAGKERAFPALPLVASHRRAQRRPLSVSSVSSMGSAPPPPSAESQSPVFVNMPGAKPPSEPRLETSPITMTKSEPPSVTETVAQTIGRAQSLTESRLAIRHLLEIEVAIECAGTKRVGFTENMSTGGVFVATYLSAAQGQKVVVELTTRVGRGDEVGETVRLAGEARWQRPSASERWPGVGVKFDDSGPEHEARMNKLLSLRNRVL